MHSSRTFIFETKGKIILMYMIHFRRKSITFPVFIFLIASIMLFSRKYLSSIYISLTIPSRPTMLYIMIQIDNNLIFFGLFHFHNMSRTLKMTEYFRLHPRLFLLV